MTPDELRRRTKNFALRIISLTEALPNRRAANAIANQILRSGMSVGANYRAVCRARSDAEFAAKLCIVVEEVDETAYWLELIEEAGFLPSSRLQDILCEANELTAIFAASRKTIKARTATKPPARRATAGLSPNQKSPNL